MNSKQAEWLHNRCIYLGKDENYEKLIMRSFGVDRWEDLPEDRLQAAAARIGYLKRKKGGKKE